MHGSLELNSNDGTPQGFAALALPSIADRRNRRIERDQTVDACAVDQMHPRCAGASARP